MNDDPSLLAAARSGDQAAFAALYRGHLRRAMQEARKVVSNAADAEDCVAMAFASTFQAIRGGGGPEGAFRPYLMAATRNAALQMVRPRRYSAETATDVLEPPAHVDVYEIGIDPTIRNAFDGLPARWKEVLWKTEVEGSPARDIAAELSMSANSVAALAKRARDGFRKAYLTTAIGSDPHPWAVERLAPYRDGALEPRQRDLVELHLEDCRLCRDTLAAVPVHAASVGAILLLGGAVPSGAGLAVAAGSGATGLVGRLRDGSRPARTSVGIAAAIVVALAAAGIAVAIGSRGATTSTQRSERAGNTTVRSDPPVGQTPDDSTASASPPVILPPKIDERSTTVAFTRPVGPATSSAAGGPATSTTRPFVLSEPPLATRPPVDGRLPAGGGPAVRVTAVATTVAPAAIPPAPSLPASIAPASSAVATTIATVPSARPTVAPPPATTVPATAPATTMPTTTAPVTAAPVTTAPAPTTTAAAPQYGGNVSLARGNSGSRTATLVATAPDGLPVGTELRFSFTGTGTLWTVSFAAVSNCAGLPTGGLIGAPDLPQSASCTTPALSIGQSATVTFIADDPSSSGNDNDTVAVRLEAQRPGGSPSLPLCDPRSC